MMIPKYDSFPHLESHFLRSFTVCEDPLNALTHQSDFNLSSTTCFIRGQGGSGGGKVPKVLTRRKRRKKKIHRFCRGYLD
jgi:hypothetical protein